MNIILGSAESGDQSFDNIRLVLFGALWLAVTAALVFVPIRIALRRRHRRAQAIAVLTILCGALAVGSILLSLSARQEWAREDMLRLQTGYYDPHDHQHDPPATPWPLWAGLAVVYALLVVWSVAGRADERSSP